MSKDRYRHVAKFATETPWAIMPETLRVIQDVLAARLAGDHWSDEEIEARIDAAGGRRPARQQRQAPGAVAVIPLSGVIAPRANLMTQMSGGTSVEEFQQAFLAAMTDPDVGAVVLDVDSPGGSTDLLTEAAGRMRAVRGQKPVLAVADTLMASAAYWLGSQADEVAVTPSGLAGSIGVYATHMDVSGANEKLGVKPTLISAGRFKTEGNPHEPLTSEAAAHIQEIVDAAYDTFTLDVSKGRRVAVSDVRDGFGEGRVLTAKQAVKQGLADRVATLEETISRAAQLAQDGVAGGQVASVAFMAELDEHDDQAPEEAPTENEPEAGGRAADASFADDVERVLCTAEMLVDQGRALTAAKRERLEALRERLGGVLAVATGEADGGPSEEPDEAALAVARFRIQSARGA
jgi:signal peptide peptidase SppA